MGSNDKAADDGALSLPAEWARGRDAIDKCDERIDGIRKQGLTFLTGLLTAQAVVGATGWVKEGSGRTAVSFAVLAFSLVVVLAVRLFEKQNQVLQAAVAARCLVIESYLTAELTDTITDRHTRQRWPLLTFLLYLSFGALALVLYEGLQGHATPWRPSTNGVVALVVFAAALAVLSIVDLRATCVRGLDWSVSRTVVRPGDSLQVRVVNLDRRPRRLPSYPRVVKVTGTLEAGVAAAAQPHVPEKHVAAEALRRWVARIGWRSVDAVPGRLELAVVLGSLVTPLVGLGRFDALGVALCGALAAGLVAAGIYHRIELVRSSVLGWPLAGAVLVAVLRSEVLPADLRGWIDAHERTLASHDRALVLVLVALGAATLAAACAAMVRLSRHETTGADAQWPEGWRGGRSGAVCFVPPLGSFVWTIKVPGDATGLAISLVDRPIGDVHLRKRIVVLARLVVAALAASTLACATPRSPAAPDPAALFTPPLALRWFRGSAEREAAYAQAYRQAADVVERAAARTAGPWAVVLDVDETVLDNGAYQDRVTRSGAGFQRASWDAWVHEKKAVAFQPARAFIAAVQARGGLVAIVTNRDESQCAATAENLRAEGIQPDALLCAAGPGADKQPRFERVASGAPFAAQRPVTVLLFVGDSVQDCPGQTQASLDLARFGDRCVVLPNPMYGTWTDNPYPGPAPSGRR
jgi:5'-nucleotidase (lipoprotein e(P4) family)